MASTFTNLLYHIVFSTKNRRPTVSPVLQDELYKYIGGIVRSEGGKLLEAGGMPDHVHIVAKLKADTSVSETLRVVKSNSSKWVNERPNRASLRFGWQAGYSAFTVSESQLASVRAYVRNQERHHRKLSFAEELEALLRKHGINYDPRFVLD